MQRNLGKLFDRLMLGMAWVGALCIVFVVLLVSVGAISRFVFHYSMSWSTELTEYALLYTTFLLAPYVLKQDGHVRVDIVLNGVKKRSVRAVAILEMIGNFLGIIIFGLIAYYGILVTADNFARHVLNPTFLRFPKAWLLIVIPLSCICMVIQFGRRLVASYSEFKAGEDSGHGQIEESAIEMVHETS